MKQSTKLFLDILMGAVIPILILNNLTRPLGAPTAYVIAALFPVGWVFIDLFFITKRFNFITSYIGLSAIINGVLAFIFVDGLLYAIKDTSSLIFSTFVFLGSILISKPILKYFFIQALNANTPEKEAALAELVTEPEVRRSFTIGTWIIIGQNIIAGWINFYLNITNVTAAFGTEEFNQQVAYVNGISRLVFPILSVIAFAIALWYVYRALYKHLPNEEGKSQIESDFWELVQMRTAQRNN